MEIPEECNFEENSVYLKSINTCFDDINTYNYVVAYTCI